MRQTFTNWTEYDTKWPAKLFPSHPVPLPLSLRPSRRPLQGPGPQLFAELHVVWCVFGAINMSDVEENVDVENVTGDTICLDVSRELYMDMVSKVKSAVHVNQVQC